MNDVSELIEKYEYGKTYSRAFGELLIMLFLNSIQYSLPEVKIDHEGMFLQSGIFNLGKTRLSKRELQQYFNLHTNDNDNLFKIKNMLDEWDKTDF